MRIVLCTNLLVALLLAPADPASLPSNPDTFAPVEINPPAPPVEVPAGVEIHGVVRHEGTPGPVVGVRVVLDCPCLAKPREQRTDGDGRYRFADLPAGAYFITVHGNYDQLTTAVRMPAETTFFADFWWDYTNKSEEWRVVRAERPVSASEAVAIVVVERPKCDRACRKAKRKRRSQRSCPCPPFQRCPV
jgi:hypothetical protein